jgi:hypothetical protein
MQQFSLFDQCVMLPYNNQVRERCLSFTCGDTDLDDFFHNDAERYAAELMGKTYCWITEQKPHRIVALSGKGALTEEDYNDSLIKKAKIIFRPGTILAGALETLKYSKVAVKYTKEEEEEDNSGFEE